MEGVRRVLWLRHHCSRKRSRLSSSLPFLPWSFFLFLHLHHGWLLISWLKMSDTRTIDRACASSVRSQERPLVDIEREKNDYMYERTTGRERKRKDEWSSTWACDPGLKSLYRPKLDESPARIQWSAAIFRSRILEHRVRNIPAITTRVFRSPLRPIFPAFDHK